MLKTIVNNKFTYWILALYAIDLVWWGHIQYFGLQNTNEAYYFNLSYGLIAISGALYGIRVAISQWGGTQSILGRGLLLLPIGLLCQAFGVTLWWYYNVIAQIEVPYPSLADVGFFGLVPAYTAAAMMFAIASGAKFTLKTKHGKLIAWLIPPIALGLSYVLFVKDIGIDLTQPVKTFFDIAYPLGEIIPVSIAIFTLTLSKRLSGGTMQSRIQYLVFAFSFQFITEYTFLYAAGNITYVNGGLNDLLYATSYMIMSLGLIAFSDYH